MNKFMIIYSLLKLCFYGFKVNLDDKLDVKIVDLFIDVMEYLKNKK